MTAPGRVCPLHYAYRPEALCVSVESADADALYIAGGLYGNPFALDRIEAMAAAERAAGRRVRLIFNGDFNWFNAEPEALAAVSERVLRHIATLGNVEWELADAHPGAGCGCGYPEWVSQAVVDRSNGIMQRLQRSAQAVPALCGRLRSLPRTLCLELAGSKVLIVHGDPESLAGWGLSHELLSQPSGRQQLQDWFVRSGADLIVSTHTCLPHLWQGPVEGRLRSLLNNGSAGMGNFHGDPRGYLVRIAEKAHPEASHRLQQGRLNLELLPVAFDLDAWWRQFRQWWPEGSDADLSYAKRIRAGTALEPSDIGPFVAL